MSAVEVLAAARGAGLRIAADGDDLVLRSDTAPPAMIIEELKCHKAEILALTRSKADSRSQEDWRALFDERAAIAEFDGGLSRPQSEALAFSECMHQWLRQNEPLEVPPSSDQDSSRCHLCGDDVAGRSDVIITICGRWCHIGCHERWLAERYGRATEALRCMGIGSQSAVGRATATT